MFASILQVLNLTDLGFSAAIVYNMYKPLAEDDIDTVCQLLNYYRTIYRIVGAMILGGGLIIMPLIPHLIKGEWLMDINIYFVYILYLINTVLSYFLFAYKSALLTALQRLDLTKISYTIANCIQYILQIISIVLLHNFYFFIIAMIFGTIFKNMICAYVSVKKFPQYFCKGGVSVEIKRDIMSRVKGLLICNISGVTYTTFDSIILSRFLGLSTVAIYNNYITIFNGVMTFVVLIRNAMQASVGDSIATESAEKNYQDMLLWQFLYSLIAIWCVTCLLNLYQPFVMMWMGESMLLHMGDVILLCIWLFFDVVSHAFCLYLSGKGLWWEMRWPYILSTICNLLLNILLAKICGTTGIILATVIASLVFGMIWQCLIIFKCYFRNESFMKYLLKQAFLFGVCVLSCGCSYLINSYMMISGVEELLIKGLICTIVSGVVVIVTCRRTKIYRRAKEFAIRARRV
ncbi:MAG: oligosaccharide flippase family protein [Ruminococcus flavefaciens]|nr:oligosaccharide flippase family protein [Ruminococcus flavefaciens]